MRERAGASEDAGPLAGTRVLELGSVVSAPFAGLQLAELGADVVKVESPGGDMLRRMPPRRAGWSAYFVNLNRGKRSVVLDLAAAEGRRHLEGLLAGADVVIENWRPGVAARLGVDAPSLRARFPSIVVASIRGFGETGPDAGQRAYDKVLQGVAGLATIQHGRGRPEVVRTPLVDKVAGMALVQGILAALVRRGQTGRGDTVAVSLLDTALWFAWPDVMRGITFVDAELVEDDGGAGFGVARCADGRWLTYTAITDVEWTGLCTAVGRPAWLARVGGVEGRLARWASVTRGMRSWARTLSRDAALGALRSAEVPCGPVNDPASAVDDPQVRHSGAVGTFAQAPSTRARGARSPIRLAGERRALRPAPALGEHTHAVLAAAAAMAGGGSTPVGA